jgi:hypothetical protein
MLNPETVESVKAEAQHWAASVVDHAASTNPPPETVEELKERVSLLIDSRFHEVHWLDDDLQA